MPFYIVSSNKFPAIIEEKISQYLSLGEAAIFNQSPIFWYFKILQHFPYISPPPFAEIHSPRKLFWNIYQKNYEQLTKKERLLFSEVKENNFLLADKLTRNNYLIRDNQGLTLAQWMAVNNKQKILEALYNNVKIKHTLRMNDLQWKIYCQRPLKPFLDPARVLHWAIGYGNLEAVKYIVSKINPEYKSLEQALIAAAEYNQLNVVIYLYGLINLKNQDEFKLLKSILAAAIEKNSLNVLVSLCNLIDWNKDPIPKEFVSSLLSTALRYKNEYFVKLFEPEILKSYLASIIGSSNPHYHNLITHTLRLERYGLAQMLIQSGLFLPTEIKDFEPLLPKLATGNPALFLHVENIKLHIRVNEARIAKNYSALKDLLKVGLVFGGIGALLLPIAIVFPYASLMFLPTMGFIIALIGLGFTLDYAVKCGIAKIKNHFLYKKIDKLENSYAAKNIDSQVSINEIQPVTSFFSTPLPTFFNKAKTVIALQPEVLADATLSGTVAPS
ncbi:ankyrin repeat domain-containing protein [Legionella fairfieldensis]|uniref:ankyrin repeat domain-containing protein n=1 Tax=Legionella fairfieldensis TaxID=45064 RepID=UPI000490C452|nr:ankyrin repeat domain-containing protein [Legionella fairfieldensis]